MNVLSLYPVLVVFFKMSSMRLSCFNLNNLAQLSGRSLGFSPGSRASWISGQLGLVVNVTK